VLKAREVYQDQVLSHAGDFDEGNAWIELYTCLIEGEPTNAAGQAEHIVVNHRPRSSVLLFARLMGEKFAGTPLEKYFITSDS
jgi:hypothetical protein